MSVRYLQRGLLISTMCMAAAGCADTNKQPTTQPLTLEQRNQKIIDDPTGYGAGNDPSSVNQHGLGPDQKPTMKKDIDNFLNP